MTIDRDGITTAVLKLVPGKAWVLKLTELDEAFTQEMTAGRPALEFLNGILAAHGGPQGRLQGRLYWTKSTSRWTAFWKAATR